MGVGKIIQMARKRLRWSPRNLLEDIKRDFLAQKHDIREKNLVGLPAAERALLQIYEILACLVQLRLHIMRPYRAD